MPQHRFGYRILLFEEFENPLIERNFKETKKIL